MEKTFDIAIINPPYDGKGYPKYLKFAKKALDCSKEVVSLMPMIWATSIKNNPKFEPYRERMGLEELSEPIAFEGLTSYQKLAVHRIKERKDCETDYTDYWFREFPDEKQSDFVSVLFKVQGRPPITRSLKLYFDERPKIDETKWYVVLSGVRGNFGYWDWTTLLSSDYLEPINRAPNVKMCYVREFEDIKRAEKFIEYLNTDFAMFCLFLAKRSNNNMNGELDYIPDVELDSDVVFDDEFFKREFGLTESDIDFIHRTMKNYGYKARRK